MPSRSGGGASTRPCRCCASCSTATAPGSKASSTPPAASCSTAAGAAARAADLGRELGSPPGLRRVARLGDGWLASAYNTTPERFREGLDRLAEELRRLGKAPQRFPSAIATAWLHVTEDTAAAERTLGEVLAPMLHRPVEALRSAPLLIGPAEVCAERLAAFVAAGARRIFVWPRGTRCGNWRFRERVTSFLPR